MLQEDQEKIEGFKKHIIQTINEKTIEDGEIPPHMVFLIKENQEYKNALFMIPNDFFQSGDTKDFLAEKVIPTIISQMNSSGKELLIFSIAMEGWMWEGKKEDNWEQMDYEEIKKTQERVEILTLTFETKESTESHIYEKRGTKKNEQGEYIEGVYLHPKHEGPMKNEGRFGNLFKAALEVQNG